MTPSQLSAPSKATLRKYGLSQETWYTMLDRQGGCCPVCGKEFTPERRPVIDHEHLRGYKKMTSENRAKVVRGLLHNWCNHRLVAKGMTVERAYGIYLYLSDYEARKNS